MDEAGRRRLGSKRVRNRMLLAAFRLPDGTIKEHVPRPHVEPLPPSVWRKCDKADSSRSDVVRWQTPGQRLHGSSPGLPTSCAAARRLLRIGRGGGGKGRTVPPARSRWPSRIGPGGRARGHAGCGGGSDGGGDRVVVCRECGCW